MAPGAQRVGLSRATAGWILTDGCDHGLRPSKQSGLLPYRVLGYSKVWMLALKTPPSSNQQVVGLLFETRQVA